MSAESWDSALDQIEADLLAIEAALGTEQPVPDATARELPVQPLPAELGDRAAALLARTRSLEERAREEIDGIRGCLRALAGRPAPAPAPTGRIIDVGA